MEAASRMVMRLKEDGAEMKPWVCSGDSTSRRMVEVC